MARKQVIKPDFTINNINAVNNDPGARNLVGGIIYKPARYVQKFDESSSRGQRAHNDNLSVAKKTNLTALNFDGNSDYVQFSDHSDFSFIRTIEQDTINFTNNNANSKITVADDSTLSMNKVESTRVTNFVTGPGDNDTYYTLADSGHTFSNVNESVEVQTIQFVVGDTESYVEVNDADALSFSKQTEVSALAFGAGTGGTGTNARHLVMSADDDDFDMGDGSSDDPFCFAFWIYPTSTTGTDYIFGKYEDTGNDTGYRCALDASSGKITFKIVGRDGGTTLEINDFESPLVSSTHILGGERNSWTHIAIRYTPDTSGTGANNDEEVQFFKNGSAWGSAVTTSNNDYVAMQNTSRPFTIGKFNTDDTSFEYFGRLSNFLVFKHDGASGRSSTGLTDAQVGGLYNNGLVYDYNDHPKSADLVAWWKMDEDRSEVTSITDYSGNNHSISVGASMPHEVAASGLYSISATNFTISFWYKRDGAPSNFRYVLYKASEIYAFFYGSSLYLYVYDRYAPKGGVSTQDYRVYILSIGSNITDWQHLVIRFNASTKAITYNVNGGTNLTHNGNDTDSGFGEIHNTTNKLYIGAATANNTSGFDGQISNFIIFNHDGFERPGVLPDRGTALLSDAEAYQLYDRDGTQGNASSIAGRPWDYNSHAKKNDIVAWWKLDETVGSATTIADSSAYETPNNGVTKTTTTPALTNPANSGLTSAIPQDTNFSISFWMKKDTTSTGGTYILSKGTTEGTDLEYQIYQDDREIVLKLVDNTPTDGNGTSGTATYRTSAAFLSNNTTDWEHITIVYTASTQEVKFYKNGSNAETVAHSSADSDQDYDSMFKGGANLFIGQNSTTGGGGFDGRLAHLAIFRHDGQSGRSSAVPTATEVLAAYNGGNVYDYYTSDIHAKKDDLVGYWKLNGTTATVGGNLTAGAGITTSVDSNLLSTEDVDMTFAFWFKKSAAESSVRTIVAKNNEYQIFVNGQDLQFRMFDAYPSDGGAASYKTHYKAGFVADNTNWQHIVIKYDASTETATFILNGGTPTVASAIGTADHDDFHDTTSQLTIGYSDFQTSLGFAGQIAQLAIFKHDGLDSRSSTILTDNEAKGLYNGGNVYDYTRHPKAADLIGYWKLNEDISSTATITDYSGLSNDGATTGTGTTTLTNPANSGLNEVKDNSFTVGFWMNKDSDSDSGNIIYKTSEYYIAQSGRDLQLAVYDSTDMDSNTEGSFLATATNALASGAGTWEHVIISYDAANRQVEFFVDGASAADVSVSSDADYNEMQDGGNVLRIGHTSDSFDGKLSNVIMFDHGAAGLPFDATDALELYSDGYVYDYNNHSRASDIVAWWKLDGDGNDSHTGGSRNGTVNGPENATNSGLYEFEDQDFAIGFFIRSLDSANHPLTRYLFHKYFEYYVSHSDTALAVNMRDTTPKQVGGSISFSTNRRFSFSYSLPMNQFTHVVVSYDKSEEKMHLYIDGVEQGSGVSPSTDADYQESGGNEGNFYLGNYSTGNTSDADLSHFVIFKNRHLTESEADELYNNGIGYNYLNHSRASDITAFYKLDESLNNSTLVDSSGNNNDLTTTNVDIEETEEIPVITGAKKLPQLPMRMHIPGVASLRTNPQK